MANHRQQLTQYDLEIAMASLQDKLSFRVQQKGMGTMASCHEIYGIIAEENMEFLEAIQENQTAYNKVEELLDIAVACVFGIASIKSNGVDW